MKILYVAKHDCGDNQDEQAIAYALAQLGHDVVKIHEKPRHRTHNLLTERGDFLLFHKCEDMTILKNPTPKAFWYFDLVDSEDPTLKPRATSRVQWMRQFMPHCLVGFCTDGDWVEKCKQTYPNKLYHLMQGADERMVGFGDRKSVV